MRIKVWLGYNYRGEVSEDEAWKMATDFMQPIEGGSIEDALGKMMRMKFEDGSSLNLSIDKEVDQKERLIHYSLHASTASYKDSQAKHYLDMMAQSFKRLGVEYTGFIRKGLAPKPMLHRIWKLSHQKSA